MANNAQNVSFGKPKATGGIWIAPKGTTLPTDATTALSNSYLSLGYISEDGLTDSIETDTEEVKAWGGDTVLTGQTSFAEKFTFNMLETNNDALKFYYGADNVTVNGDEVTVKVNSQELEEVVMVAEVVLTGGRIQRIVVPHAKLFDRSGDITYVDSSAVMYPVNILALPDSNQNTSTKYVAVVASS